ncbi:MAG: O-antigen ligase family protein, partial [Chloroflexota bacterium]
VPVARDLIVRRLPVVAPPLMGWMIALLFIHVVSALFSADLVRSWDAVVIYAVEGVGLTFLLINVIRTPAMLRQATWVLIGAGAFVSLMSVHQDLTNNYDSNYWGFAQVSNAAFGTGQATLTGDVVQRRLAGSIGETNRFAQVMLMLIPLGIFRYIGEPTRILRLTAAVATTIITLGVVLTFSRGGAVGLASLLIALAVLRMVRWRHLAAILLSLSVVFAAFPHYWERVTSITQLSALVNPDSSRSEVGGAILSRATEGLAAVLIMADHPVIGIGPAMYPVNYEAYAKVIGIRVKEGETRESHNLYLGLGAEIGVVGLGIFLIIAYLVLRMIVAARQRSLDRRSDLEQLVTPFGLALMTYYVTGMFLHLSFARFYWLMLAVGVAAALIVLREMRTEDGRTGRSDQGAYSQSV